MTQAEFEDMHVNGDKNLDQPVYVFNDEGVFYEYSDWVDTRRHYRLLCALAGDLPVKEYLDPKFANAEVKKWGIADGRLCVVIQTD